MATWATSGAATDFTAADGPGAGEETMSRANLAAESIPGRIAVLGATNYTDVEVGVHIYKSATAEGVQQAVVARYVDANNYAYFSMPGGSNAGYVSLVQVVAGVRSTLASQYADTPPVTWQRLRLTCRASGGCVAELLNSGGAMLARLEATSPALATGGALASGKPGFFDVASGGLTVSRYYDNFYVMQPPAEPIAIYGGQLAEVTSDKARRLSSDGSTWGQVPAYRGSYFTVPPAGTNNRKARIAVAARRNDIIVAADDPVTDSITVQTFWSPVWLAVPR